MDSKGNSKICDYESSSYYKEGQDYKYDKNAYENDYLASSISNQHATHYSAPEIFEYSNKTDNKVDFWALGILIFKMFTGNFPFLNKKSILNDDIPNLEYMNISKEAKEILTRLLKRNKHERLGSKNVKKDAFFSGMNWIELEIGQIEPPFKPILVINFKIQIKNIYTYIYL